MVLAHPAVDWRDKDFGAGLHGVERLGSLPVLRCLHDATSQLSQLWSVEGCLEMWA